MDCFHQTNEQKNSVLFYKIKEKPRLKNRWDYRKQKCLMFPFSNAAPSVSPPDVETMQSRETANHTDPTQAGDEHSTQKSAKYMDDKFKIKKTKIKLHKIFCEYIYKL